MKKLSVIIIFIIFAVSYNFSGSKKLTFDQVTGIKGERLFKPLPRVMGWADSINYFELEMKSGVLYKVNARTGKKKAAMDPKKFKKYISKGFRFFPPEDRTKDFSKFLIKKGSDLFVYIKNKDMMFRITNDKTDKKNATFSPDGNKVAYTVDGNLFVYIIKTKETVKLTNDGSKQILNGYASWVYYEEILGRRSKYKAFWWSPDNNRIAFMKFDQHKVPVFSYIKYNSDYDIVNSMRYPKAGYPNPTVKIGVVNIDKRKTRWIPFIDKNEHYLAFPFWDKKGKTLYFQWLNREQDHIKILRYYPSENKIVLKYEEKQKAWINFYTNNDFVSLKNGSFLLRSTKSGWAHIYYISTDDVIKQITNGDWTVNSIGHVDEKRGLVFFNASKKASTDSALYSIKYKKKGNITKISKGIGIHRTVISPDGKYFIDTYSTISIPEKMDVLTLKGKLIRNIGDSALHYHKYNLSKPELFKIKTDDGYLLPAVWYLPPDFDKNKKYPVLLTVYGGPLSPIVHNSFNDGYRRGLAKFYYAQNGIINIFVDHRGTGHYGKKGADMMHRKLGKWEIYDYSQVAKYLRNLSFVNKDKIGITGHSYGGYVAALMMTKAYGVFNYGSSNSPVTDWRFYDSVYTERFMDTPQSNKNGYKESSSLTYLDKYKGGLLMTHGTLDDNVHIQNAILFIREMLDNGQSMEFMLYPGNKHGIRDKKRIPYFRSELNFWKRNFGIK